ncbi:unnamed protein product [Colias eurytheme]|nr:unnamed protein product [Colias eurytheme]
MASAQAVWKPKAIAILVGLSEYRLVCVARESRLGVDKRASRIGASPLASRLALHAARGRRYTLTTLTTALTHVRATNHHSQVKTEKPFRDFD